MTKQIFKNIQPPPLYDNKVKMERLIRKVALKHKLYVSEIKGSRQFKSLAIARAEFIVKAVHMDITRQEIGDFLGRHNSTITGIYKDNNHLYEKD